MAPNSMEQRVSISKLTSPPVKLESVGGAVPLHSDFYIARSCDKRFTEAVARHESIVVVRGTRQVGKTSLLARGLQLARSQGEKVILTDIQKFNASELESARSFLLTLADLIAEQLDLDVQPESLWSSSRTPQENFKRFLEDEILPQISSRLVWGFDELDRLFVVPYGEEMFTMIRAWQKARDRKSGLWNRLSLAVSYATEASLFKEDLDLSPFETRTCVTLEDFTREEVAEVNRRYGSPLKPEGLECLFLLVGGHPFLVRRALHEIVAAGVSFDELNEQADREDGIFGDHLRRIPFLLGEDPAFKEIVRGVFYGNLCPTHDCFRRLRNAGLVVGGSELEMRPRCSLYSRYLKRHLT